MVLNWFLCANRFQRQYDNLKNKVLLKTDAIKFNQVKLELIAVVKDK